MKFSKKESKSRRFHGCLYGHCTTLVEGNVVENKIILEKQKKYFAEAMIVRQKIEKRGKECFKIIT
jgi:hypothetical protein